MFSVIQANQTGDMKLDIMEGGGKVWCPDVKNQH